MGSAKIPEKINERLDSDKIIESNPIPGRLSNLGVLELKQEIARLKTENIKLNIEIDNLKNGSEIALLREKIRRMALLLKSPKKSKNKKVQETRPIAKISIIKATSIRKIMKKKGDDLPAIKKSKTTKSLSG
jgi:hypothetical protein